MRNYVWLVVLLASFEGGSLALASPADVSAAEPAPTPTSPDDVITADAVIQPSSKDSTLSPLPVWTIMNKEGDICMLLSMEAYDSWSGAPIPSEAHVDPDSDCNDENHAFVKLSWNGYDFAVYSVSMDFWVQSGNYTLTKIKLSTSRTGEISWVTSRLRTIPSVPLGTSMTCRDFDGGVVYFSRFKFQAFARYSSGTFGPERGCYLTHLPRAGLIVAMTILSVVALIALVLCLGCLCRRRRTYRRI